MELNGRNIGVYLAVGGVVAIGFRILKQLSGVVTATVTS